MFYGWWIVASVFVAQFFMVGFFTYTFPLVAVAVKESFGATATEINMAMTVSVAAGIVLPPVVGPLVDRWSARKLMMIGALLLSSSLGLLSLSGMLIKNGIVLVDEIRLQIDSGKEAYSALVDSAISRVRPVSMAALTTILGMAPLLTDAFFQSMAVVIMFGLGFATVLTLVVLPVIYSLFFKIPVEGRRV